MAQTDSVGLDQRIQALAQELQDLIFDAYLKTGTGTLITITGAWKPPAQHQIDRKSRAKAMATYYSTNTFVIPPAPYCSGSTPYPDLAIWILRLSASNRDSIRKIRLQASWTPSRAVPNRLKHCFPRLEEEETAFPTNIRSCDARGLCAKCFSRARFRMDYLRYMIARSRSVPKSLAIEVDIPMVKQNDDIEMQLLTEAEIAQMPQNP